MRIPSLAVLILVLLPFPIAAEKSIDSDRFQYLGAFRVPSGHTPSDITYYPSGDPGGGDDGFPGSFFIITGQNQNSLDGGIEISIPAPEIRANADSLPVATLLTNATPITCNLESGVQTSGGIAYLDVGGAVGEKLYWNAYEYYNTSGDDHDPGGWIKPDFTGCAGTWHYGPKSSDTYHSMKIENYMFRIWDTDWADSVLGGRYLISGKTRSAGTYGSGQGINLYAVAPYLSGNPPANNSVVSAQVLMHYEGRPSPIKMPGIDGDPPYRACDRFSGGAWVRVGNEDAVVIVGRKSLGGEYYGDGRPGDCKSSKGYHCDPYEPRFWFIDPSDFEPVIAGTANPWDVVPYATYDPANETYWDTCPFLYEWHGGADFDYANSIFYFNEYIGGGKHVVHAYRVVGSDGSYTLNVAKTGAGFGTVNSSPPGINCGVDCQEVYNQGTTVSLDAIANNGSYFAGWSGDSDCGDGTVTMSFDRNCTARFQLGSPPEFTLTITKTGTGSGTVISSPTGIDCGGLCEEDFLEGTALQLAAQPDGGSIFGGWSGSADCSDGQLTMNNHRDCIATFNEAPLDLGLIAAYSLDEGSGNIANDASGYGNHGTIHGASWNGEGYFGNTLAFDGVNDYIDLGPLDIPGNAMTITTWVRQDVCSQRDCRIVSKSTGTSEDAHYIMLSTDQDSQNLRLRFRLKTGGTTTTLVASSGHIPDYQWRHAAAVYNGAQMKLFLDGVLVGSQSKNGNITNNGSVPMWIGGNPPGESDKPWKGPIDEIRIYDRALTPSEIQQDMDTPVGLNTLFWDGFESGNFYSWHSAVN